MKNPTLNEILQIADRFDKVGSAIQTLLLGMDISPCKKLTGQLRRCVADLDQEMSSSAREYQYEVSIEIQGLHKLYYCSAESVVHVKEKTMAAYPGCRIFGVRFAKENKDD